MTLVIVRNLFGPQIERLKKKIIEVFKENDLNITTEAGIMQTDFLDATFDLTSESFWPYGKPNSNPQYIHTSSNHLPNIKKQLPNMIAKSLSQNSIDKSEFEKAAPDYGKALQKSGYNIKLQYKVPKKPKSRNRRQNSIWFNPPYNATVKTNIGKEFFRLLNKHFPKHSSFHQLFNRNNVKLSYSCTPSMSSIHPTTSNCFRRSRHS